MTVDMRLRHISGACATFNLEIAFWSLDPLAVVAARRNLPQPLVHSVECVALVSNWHRSPAQGTLIGGPLPALPKAKQCTHGHRPVFQRDGRDAPCADGG